MSTTRTNTDNLTETIERVDQAIRRASRHLLDHLGQNGHPGARHGHYYRLPWTLALTGHTAEATAVLAWIEDEALDDQGDLRDGEPRQAFATAWASYPLAIIATGAWHLERYDLASRLAGRLADYQHPESGGAYAAHPDHRRDERQDLFPTAQLGMTGLTTGSTELAHGAFRWMASLYESQPDLPRRLFTATDGDRLITEVDDPKLAWQVITDFTVGRQAFYNPGIAAAFLGRYHMFTGSQEALDLARAYLELTVAGTDAQFDYTESVQVCKFAWGASVLSEATGEVEYLRHVLRMAEWFLAAQNEDGTWDNSPFLMERGGHHPSIRAEITAEFVQHLTSIQKALGHHQRKQHAKGA